MVSKFSRCSAWQHLSGLRARGLINAVPGGRNIKILTSEVGCAYSPVSLVVAFSKVALSVTPGGGGILWRLFLETYVNYDHILNISFIRRISGMELLSP